MKRKLQKSIFALAMLGLVASCSTSNEVASNRGIQKRKYTKGYFIDFNHNKGGNSHENLAKGNENVVNNEELAIEESFVRNLEQEVIYVEPEVTVEQSNVTPTEVERNIESPGSAQAVNTNNLKDNGFKKVEIEELNEIQSPNKFKNKTPRFIKKNTASFSNEMSEDAILYYILAILIPFLAVGLVTDWDITKVIICLLLCFLFYLPGMIYALIVVHNNV